MDVNKKNTDFSHSVFVNFPTWSGACPENCHATFVGNIIRTCFTDSSEPLDFTSLSKYKTVFKSPSPPPVTHEDYFEFFALLQAIETASDRFVMMELGAGFGRWLVNAALAMRATRDLPIKLIGFEAEPEHFAMLRQHFLDNSICPDDHMLLQAAISAKEGSAFFTIGNSVDWYGQETISADEIDSKNNWIKNAHPGSTIIEVPAVTLSSLLKSEKLVDLIDADIQGAELDVMTEAQEQLNDKVKYVFIGTHETKLEYGLRELFTRNGWFNVYDFPCFSEWPTWPGKITSFQDGVQLWINPRLVDNIPDGARVYYTSNFLFNPDDERNPGKAGRVVEKPDDERNPSEADRVVEKLRQHRIIWFFILVAYKVSAKLYGILRAIKRIKR